MAAKLLSSGGLQSSGSVPGDFDPSGDSAFPSFGGPVLGPEFGPASGAGMVMAGGTAGGGDTSGAVSSGSSAQAFSYAAGSFDAHWYFGTMAAGAVNTFTAGSGRVFGNPVALGDGTYAIVGNFMANRGGVNFSPFGLLAQAAAANFVSASAAGGQAPNGDSPVSSGATLVTPH